MHMYVWRAVVGLVGRGKGFLVSDIDVDIGIAEVGLPGWTGERLGRLQLVQWLRSGRYG